MKTRTLDDIYEEIKAAKARAAARDSDDSPAYWIAAAEDYERVRDLWREIGTAAEDTRLGLPTWAVAAAWEAGNHASDIAHQYRRFARDVAKAVSIKET